VAAYAQHDHYRDLRDALARVADHLVDRGWRAAVVADDNALVDRAAAHRAGIGWFGKNSLVLLPGLGSRVVLGTVVTDAVLRPSPPAVPADHGEGCGSCRNCQVACPTGALDEAGVVDARRCLAWLVQAPGPFPVEHRAALGDRIYGCDECQRVCPVNRAADRRSPAPAPEADSRPRVEVLRLLDAEDAELLVEFGRWYIPGRDPRYIRRNALVVLGNVGDGGDHEVAAALSRWIGGDDDLLAEHARWAALQLGRADLVTAGR
jgi:epoxyqueuosine reductase